MTDDQRAQLAHLTARCEAAAEALRDAFPGSEVRHGHTPPPTPYDSHRWWVTLDLGPAFLVFEHATYSGEPTWCVEGLGSSARHPDPVAAVRAVVAQAEADASAWLEAVARLRQGALKP